MAIEAYLNLSTGVYPDYWLQKGATLNFDVPEKTGLVVSLWNPDISEVYADNRVIFQFGDRVEDHVLEAGGLMHIDLDAAEVESGMHLWVGCSACHIIYDVGKERKGRRVGLRIHDVQPLPG